MGRRLLATQEVFISNVEYDIAKSSVYLSLKPYGPWNEEPYVEEGHCLVIVQLYFRKKLSSEVVILDPVMHV